MKNFGIVLLLLIGFYLLLFSILDLTERGPKPSPIEEDMIMEEIKHGHFDLEVSDNLFFLESKTDIKAICIAKSHLPLPPLVKYYIRVPNGTYSVFRFTDLCSRIDSLYKTRDNEMKRF